MLICDALLHENRYCAHVYNGYGGTMKTRLNRGGHGVRGLAALVGAAALVLVGAGVAQAAEDAGTLQIQHGAQETTGELGYAGTLVTLSTRIEADGAVSAQVQVNDVLLEARLSPDKQELSWTGHGRALFAEHRKALVALAGQLEPTTRPHEDLLRRVVMLWAEAPVGLPLGDKTLNAPAPNKAGSRRGAPALSEGARAPRDGDVPACYYPDDNGITYFSCTYQYDVVCHDADAGGHCWGCEYVPVGCGGGCTGECGPGCWGLNIVTWDCGDHDRCCEAHGGCLNPWDSNCGDEYGEAADDFAFGWPNCMPC